MACSLAKELAFLNKLVYFINPRVLDTYYNPPNYLAANEGEYLI
jgi:hypothetical protein